MSSSVINNVTTSESLKPSDIGKLVRKIRGLNNSIQDIDEKIKKHSVNIKEIIQNNRESSNRSSIASKLYCINEELKVARKERKNLKAEFSTCLKNANALRKELGSKNENGKILDPLEIDKKKEQLIDSLMMFSINQKEEKIIASRLADLEAQRSKFQESEGLMTRLRENDAEIKQKKQQLDEIDSSINILAGEANGLKEMLDKLDKENKKNTEIEKLDKEIESLKTRKKQLIDEKEIIREEIKEAEKNNLELLEEGIREKEQMEKKKSLKRSIEEKEDKISELKSTSGESDIHDLEIIKTRTKRMLDGTGRFAYDISLVSEILRFGLFIPNNREEAQKLVDKIDALKKKSKEEFLTNLDLLSSRIAELQDEIKSLQMQINSMPPTNFALIKIVERMGERKKTDAKTIKKHDSNKI